MNIFVKEKLILISKSVIFTVEYLSENLTALSTIYSSIFLVCDAGVLSRRPEITVIGARPMHETPFISTSTQNLQSSTNEGDTFSIPSNKLDCIIARTSTLPSRGKKERPKSEVYNGFSSLRAARLANGERVNSQKESKKVVRSKSLHAPKKPPRDFSMRPMSISPCGDIKEDSPAVPKLTSAITPTRPAPPVPFATFSKRNQTGHNPK